MSPLKTFMRPQPRQASPQSIRTTVGVRDALKRYSRPQPHICLIATLLLSSFISLSANANTSSQHANDDLASGLRSESATVRKNSLDLITNKGIEGAPYADELVAAWSDHDRSIRNRAYSALVGIAEQLQKKCHNQNNCPLNPEQRVAYIKTVNDALLSVLSNTGSPHFYSALDVVEKMRELSAPLYSELGKVMLQDDGIMRTRALLAMEQDLISYAILPHVIAWGTRTDPAGVRAFNIAVMFLINVVDSYSAFRTNKNEESTVLNAFRLGLNRNEIGLKLYALKGVELMGERASQLIPNVALLLDDPAVNVQQAAKSALPRLGPNALPAIIKLYNRNDTDLKHFVVTSIDYIFNRNTFELPQKEAEHYLSILGDNLDAPVNEELYLSSVKAISSMGIYAYQITPKLIQLTKHDQYNHAEELINALVEISLSIIDEQSKLHDSSKIYSVEKLEMIGRVIEHLFDLTSDDNLDKRVHALKSINRVLARFRQTKPADFLIRIKSELPRQLDIITTKLARRLAGDLAQKEASAIIVLIGINPVDHEIILPLLMDHLAVSDKETVQVISKAIYAYKLAAMEYIETALNSSNAHAKHVALSTINRLTDSREIDVSQLSEFTPYIVELITNLAPVYRGSLALVARKLKGEPNVVGALLALAEDEGAGRDFALSVLYRSGIEAIDFFRIIASRGFSEDEMLFRTEYSIVTSIADDMVKTQTTQNLDSLKIIYEKLSSQAGAENHAKELMERLNVLKEIEERQGYLKAYNYFIENPHIYIPIFTYSILLLTLLIFYLYNPTYLYKINHSIRRLDVRFPEQLGGISIPLRHLLLVGIFENSNRVLDAWVASHLDIARSNFSQKPTVSQRAVHVNLPVELANKGIRKLEGSTLTALFQRQLSMILIWGEGGSGKTSLACKLASIVCADEPENRPTSYPMIPILLEHESAFIPEQDQMLKNAVSQQLQNICDLADPPPNHLLNSLLKKKRLLVIVDHLSEMSEEIRLKSKRELLTFPARALIVTSRTATEMEGFSTQNLHPIRIAGNRLSSFMETYLSSRGKRELFTDAEFFKGCSHLADMVRDRDITALFAKLYAEEMIVSKRKLSLDGLPNSVPEMMLSYINELNRAITEDVRSDREVHAMVKLTAWLCVSKTYIPGQALLSVLQNHFGEDTEANVNYMENRLKVIQTIKPAKDAVLFVLDPMAEYFAAMYLVQDMGETTDKWLAFLDTLEQPENSITQISGFLNALKDSYESDERITKSATVLERIQKLISSK
ncbi:hypothetical protein EZV61_09830 [Corallincola luteus]|uniref:NACHT domain-containing protein n=1 Tax=Corallincola luteus TaxID=1775177 RepID=A0ABY2AMF3_9GAMM|nr:hypothetical protein [Corallincola luteus]TCI03175.1 hypothetical protein EZV61_09830 [Corallincola luteus]